MVRIYLTQRSGGYFPFSNVLLFFVTLLCATRHCLFLWPSSLTFLVSIVRSYMQTFRSRVPRLSRVVCRVRAWTLARRPGGSGCHGMHNLYNNDVQLSSLTRLSPGALGLASLLLTPVNRLRFPFWRWRWWGAAWPALGGGRLLPVLPFCPRRLLRLCGLRALGHLRYGCVGRCCRPPLHPCRRRRRSLRL